MVSTQLFPVEMPRIIPGEFKNESARQFGPVAILTGELDQIIHRHHDIAIVELHAARGLELKDHSAGAQFLDRKINNAVVDSKIEAKRRLTKFRVHFFDPILEAISCECSHVADEYEMNQLTHGFALLFGVGMHLCHVGLWSRMNTRVAM